MALHIEKPEAEELAHKLADATGKPVDDAVIEALRAELQRAGTALSRSPLRVKLDEITARIAALPTLDERSADEILGYDEHGLPT